MLSPEILHFLDQNEKLDNMLFLKNLLLALGPASYSSTQGLVTSSSSTSLEHFSSSLDHMCGCPHQLRLMPLIFGIEQLSLVAGDVGSLFNKPREWFLICPQDCDFKIVGKIQVIGFSSVCV